MAPIHLAAWFGSLDILKLLVQAGAEQKVENEVKAGKYNSIWGLYIHFFHNQIINSNIYLKKYPNPNEP